MNKIIVVFILFLMVFHTGNILHSQPVPESSETYVNPVGDSLVIADPSVLFIDGTYYLYGTSAGDGFLCWSSDNLVDWQPLGYAYQRTEVSWGKSTYWAPEVIAYRGKFYMVFSCKGGDDRSYILKGLFGG